jgi:hypothetical protein
MPATYMDISSRLCPISTTNMAVLKFGVACFDDYFNNQFTWGNSSGCVLETWTVKFCIKSYINQLSSQMHAVNV